MIDRSTLTPHERNVLTLCETLLDWVPGPQTTTGRIVASSAQPGEVAGSRERCPACAGGGRRKQRGMMVDCERCQKRGWIEVDPQTRREVPAAVEISRENVVAEIMADIELVNRDSSTRGAIREHRRQAQDAEVERLERARAVERGEEGTDDAWTNALAACARQYERGDYAHLEQALQLFRDKKPQAHAWFWRHVVLSGAARTSSQRVVRDLVLECVRWLALRVPHPCRVPAWVEDAHKQALWHGRSKQHEQARGIRNARIRKLAETMSAGEIARAEGLAKRSVERIIAEHRDEAA